jgi:hypothetical protein
MSIEECKNILTSECAERLSNSFLLAVGNFMQQEDFSQEARYLTCIFELSRTTASLLLASVATEGIDEAAHHFCEIFLDQVKTLREKYPREIEGESNA